MQGRIQDFHLGEGGGALAKIMCPHAHYERGTELTFGRGQAGPGSSRNVLMLSRAIWALFLIILIKKLDFKNRWSNFRGGGGGGGGRACCTPPPPLDPPLLMYSDETIRYSGYIG